jgi:excisionase family DNA binding protein
MRQPKDLTVKQAALRLGVTLKYVRDLLYESKLPGATKVGKRWVIPSPAVEARLKTRQGQAEQPA